MIVQGSPEWHQLRLGKVTASRIADLTAMTKSGPSASRANYAVELITERLTGAPIERYSNANMQAGQEVERDACDAYAWETDAELEECGFIDHPKIPMSGASPDRLIGGDGLLEVKCAFSAAHVDRLLGASIEGKYVKQMQFQMAVTGRAWCDFASFDPRLPPHLRLFVRRVDRDPAMIAELEREVVTFLAEIDDKIERLQSLAGTGGRDNRPQAAA
jgi:putative phage-type endonuclease